MTEDMKAVKNIFSALFPFLTREGKSHILHYLNHNEPEIALEGIILELIQQDEYPDKGVLEAIEDCARRFDLCREAVLDSFLLDKLTLWCCKQSGLFYLCSLEEFNLKMIDVFDILFESIDQLTEDLNLTPDLWTPWSEFRDSEDGCIWEKVRPGRRFTGDVYLISEITYQTKEVFIVKGGSLETFVQSYYSFFKETLFNIDTVIVSFDAKQITVVHHEEVFCTYYKE